MPFASWCICVSNRNSQCVLAGCHELKMGALATQHTGGHLPHFLPPKQLRGEKQVDMWLHEATSGVRIQQKCSAIETATCYFGYAYHMSPNQSQRVGIDGLVWYRPAKQEKQKPEAMPEDVSGSKWRKGGKGSLKLASQVNARSRIWRGEEFTKHQVGFAALGCTVASNEAL